MAIRFGFYISLLNFVRVIINQLGIWFKSPVLYYIAIVMYGINFMLFLIWFVFCQMWRFCYDGQVCSGDFLSETQREDARSHKGLDGGSFYLIAEGRFL